MTPQRRPWCEVDHDLSMGRITSFDVIDVRFPTSRELDGSDAMHPDPDYSAAYVIVHAAGLPDGHGFTFTIGRGNEICCAAIESLAHLVRGLDAGELFADMASLSRLLVHDSQLRWLGPEKGVVHLAAAAIINAVWDMRAKADGKPLWRLLADLEPEQVAGLVDWTYLEDALTPSEAIDLLADRAYQRGEREAHLVASGYPAYTTTPGWLGYSNEKLARLTEQAVEDGFEQIKLKVGADLDDDQRRLEIAREAGGDRLRIAVDANQRWGVSEAIEWVGRLARFDPYWIEEPTSPDDILGHARIRRGVAPVRVATGEHVANRVVFKQLLQAEAIDVLQLDACRVGGVNENIAILLLAAKFGVPVCPHAGGVGLCELVRHLAAFDYLSVSGSLEGRVVEFADHLHEHFVDPAVVRDGRYVLPELPGYGAEMHAESLRRFRYPDGPEWA
jgi:L-fuconate dehydratase